MAACLYLQILKWNCSSLKFFIQVTVFVIYLKIVFFKGFDNSFQQSQKSLSQWIFTCSELTIETLEQGVKYVQS